VRCPLSATDGELVLVTPLRPAIRPARTDLSGTEENAMSTADRRIRAAAKRSTARAERYLDLFLLKAGAREKFP
jgi:hypothetical protein